MDRLKYVMGMSFLRRPRLDDGGLTYTIDPWWTLVQLARAVRMLLLGE